MPKFLRTTPDFTAKYDDIFCKRELQNFYVDQIASNRHFMKESNDPILFHLKHAQKLRTPRTDWCLSYMVSNTYQTQMALASPNPQ